MSFYKIKAILYLCLLYPYINILYCIFWDFSNFYLNDMPIPEPNSVSHNLSFCEREYCRRIWGRERQNQLTGDHWNKLAHHSDKNGRGGRIRTLIGGFGDRSPNHWTTPLYGGRNKIRTCGGVTLAAFPRRCFKPLSHSSINWGERADLNRRSSESQSDALTN